jgi:stage III sporulation protein AH
MKKRGAVYSVVALMLCVAVYLNWSYNRQEEEGYQSVAEFNNAKMLGEAALVDGAAGESADVSGDYFAEARLSRQQARDEAVSILNRTIDNEQLGEEAAAEASAAIQVMAQSAMQESRIENMIMAKGTRTASSSSTTPASTSSSPGRRTACRTATSPESPRSSWMSPASTRPG